MSRKSDEYMRGVPMKPYDLIREGLIALGIVAVVVVVLAIVFKSPDAPTVRGEDVAKNHPLDYLKTATDFLSGESGLQDYGPPYTKDTDNIQRILGPGPAVVFGVTMPLDAQKDMVVAPLEKVAVLNKDVAAALAVWKAAPQDQQKAWTKAYSDALDKAEEADGQVKVPAGDYGPVPGHDAGHARSRPRRAAGGRAHEQRETPVHLGQHQGDALLPGGRRSERRRRVRHAGDAVGDHPRGRQPPGPWWLWPYAIWYQIPPLTTAPNADVIVGIAHGAVLSAPVLRPVHTRAEAPAKMDPDLPHHLAGLVRTAGEGVGKGRKARSLGGRAAPAAGPGQRTRAIAGTRRTAAVIAQLPTIPTAERMSHLMAGWTGRRVIAMARRMITPAWKK